MLQRRVLRFVYTTTTTAVCAFAPPPRTPAKLEVRSFYYIKIRLNEVINQSKLFILVIPPHNETERFCFCCLLQLKRFWIISFRIPARFTAVPKEKPAKAEARRATQYKTRHGARREFNPNNNYEPPPQAKT